MLSFVGLGLFDERSITIEGRDTMAVADRVFLEWYTSTLPGCDITDLEAFHGIPIHRLDRAAVEQDPERILTTAEDKHVVFLTGGDPLISTTHIDLRLRAEQRGIETQLVHAPSAATAASGLTGLQNYRFGKSTTIPFPGTITETVPQSVVDTIVDNRERGLHTLAYLDIDGETDSYLDAAVAAEALASELQDIIGVVVGRAGSPNPTVTAGPLEELATQEFGPPLHLLVIPGELHDMERQALETFANLDSSYI